MSRDTNIQQVVAMALLVLAGSVSYAIVKDANRKASEDSSAMPGPVKSVPLTHDSGAPVPTQLARVGEADAGPATVKGTILSASVASGSTNGWLSFARVAINEDTRALRGEVCGRPTRDHIAIFQTGQALAKARNISLDAAFRILSPRATGTKDPLLLQHRWTSNLPATGNDAPAGWDENTQGDWYSYADCWDMFRVWARRAVAGNVVALDMMGYYPPCDSGDPVTWGCSDPDGCFDDARGIARGLCVLDCGATRNTFWGKPGQGCELGDELTTAALVRATAWCLSHHDACERIGANRLDHGIVR